MVRALARVNLASIERNVRGLKARLTGTTALCAVVKGDGYGHGAVPAARAAVSGGASTLAVATAEEAAGLRAGGLAEPILVLGAISLDELPIALSARAELVAWTEAFVQAVLAAGSPAPVRMHVKLDTGMGRLGTRERNEALAVAEAILAAPGLELAGVMTHLATADDDPEFVAAQLSRFEPFAEEVRSRAPGVVVHAANSAATIREPRAHFDLVRCGIAIYGCDPFHDDPDRVGLEPALELSSYVAAVKLARPGESAGYGRRFIAERDTWLATLPIGYADGVRRALSDNCQVLIGGRRYPLVGAVSMDNVTVALGDAALAGVGERGVLIGADGSERVTAEELARRVGTINYEIVCGISARVPREYHRDGEVVA